MRASSIAQRRLKVKMAWRIGFACSPQTYLRQFSPERADDIVRQLVDHLRPTLYRDGIWTVDYRRLRVQCVRH